jgi:flagella basal body P-ring formation protein FlgA
MRWLWIIPFFCALPVHADVLVAARTLRAQSITIYAGRPVRPGDVGPPAIVERNQIVPLVFQSSILRIETEARALARAGEGERIRVLNLTSRAPVTGRVQPDGTILVKGIE